ncbi:Maf family protein [Celerinatantimonas sp. YJH-8]|uniref:Maf family protein n=1 Tax=Celerinatantimonas sp. YJH-8 TaxID=3228714 RepID=UPI0038C70B11
MDFYLASASPRRFQLLSLLDYQFCQVNGQIDESVHPEEDAVAYVQRMALEKAIAGQQNAPESLPVLGADTTISYCGSILGKPKDEVDSIRMLSLLSGQTHQVLTAVAVVCGGIQQQCLVTTDVTMRTISTAEMKDYWNSGEPVDKAGSYAIQGIGGKFITSIHGSYSSVVGLPLVESESLLKRFL